jgi:hypothetical protein
MKRRNLGARLAALVTCICIVGALSSTLGAAPAAANMNPPIPTEPCECGELSFTIEKFQEIAGSEQGFTQSPLRGAIGQTVDYKIVVKNTSDVPETFSEFTDEHCDAGTIAGGPGTEVVFQGHSTVYTCSRKLTEAGTFTNEATVTANGPFPGTPLTQTSNRVVVEVPAPPPLPPPPPPPAPPAPTPAFTIEKRQEIAGTKAGFTAAALNGTVGETVDYQIVVTNTGNAPLKFTSFSDAPCDQPTISGGPGEGAVAPGASTTYTCSHLLSSTGKYVNVASVLGTAQGAAPLSETSNPVEVNVAAVVVKPVCEAALPTPHLPSGPERKPFTVRVSSAGIKQITFYLDGRKLKTLSQAQAKAGKFTIKIDPRKMSHGVHHLAVKATVVNTACPAITASSAFVHPLAAARVVKFTG